MNITISGLTAAGKTTHALLIARRLGYDYVSASTLMLSRLGIEQASSSELWQTRMAEVEQRRDEQPVDREINKFLTRQLRDRDRTVFDSWSAGWLPGGDRSCLRLFIESDAESRTRKACVSQQPHGPVKSLAECRKLIDEKDEAAADRLGPLLGVDIRTDRSPFHLVMDNSALIADATPAAARRGIGIFHDRLTKAIAGLVSGKRRYAWSGTG